MTDNQANTAQPRRRRLVAPVTLLILGVTVCLVAALRHQHARYRHFAVHEPGKVYRSAWVDADVFGELIPQYGIRTVVNLCYPGEMGDRIVGQREAVAAAGARLIELPFPPNDTWTTDWPAVAELEAIFADPNSYPVWIHCQHGRERTVKALSIYDIRQRGWTAQQSLEAMPLFGMEHPWPIITFAHLYELEHSVARNQRGAACGVPHVADRSASDEPRQR